MNRMEFIGSINHNCFVTSDVILSFFDHMMAAYNLIGDIKNAQVVPNIISPLAMCFTISFYSKYDLDRVVDRITKEHQNSISIYDKRFNIYIDILQDNILGIQILEIQ